MGKKYTKIPEDTFKNLQLNAGILLKSFTPATGVAGEIIGATSGGINFKSSPSYTDFGEDVDNCPKNMKEFKVIDSIETTMSGTFISVTPNLVENLIGAADVEAVSGTNVYKIVPRNELLNADFEDLWWVGDYSDVNTGENAGFMAIHLMNTLNTDGFQIQTGNKAKGQFAFNYMAHYSMNAQDTVPYEIYILGSDAEPSITLSRHSVRLDVNGTVTLSASTLPDAETVTWSTSNNEVATVSNGTVTAEGAGNAIITASITVEGVTYTDTCTVIVTAAAEG